MKMKHAKPVPDSILSISRTPHWTQILVMAGLLSSTYAWAVDYSQYTTEELVQMRTQTSELNAAEHEQFQQELQKRIRNLNREERQRLGIGENGGDARERGELQRERVRSEIDSSESGSSDYGRGYENRKSGKRASGDMPTGRGAGNGR